MTTRLGPKGGTEEPSTQSWAEGVAAGTGKSCLENKLCDLAAFSADEERA